MDTLPTELLEQCLSHFTGSEYGGSSQDAKTLCSCCLVSRRFFQLAQRQLYGTIRLDVRSKQPLLLLKTLEANPRLAEAVRKLHVECAPVGPTPAEWVYQLRQFLQELLPSLRNLEVFRSDHRVSTTKLVESLLYKEGNGYYMGIPTDLSNLRSLELFAADYVYKYNYILRLPRLETIRLNSTKIVDLDHEDASLPNDWGWTSQSVKELILHPGFRPSCSNRTNLRSNSLQALSRSLPCLQTLQIVHHETAVYPWQSRCLASFFAPQIESSLRRLMIRDGRIDATHPRSGLNDFEEDDRIALRSVQASRIEHLTVDFSTLFGEVLRFDPFESMDCLEIPTSVQHLTLRYVHVNELTTNMLLERNWTSLVLQIRRHFTALKEIDLELRLFEDADKARLKNYENQFRAVGIIFTVLEHARRPPNSGSITCSRRPFGSAFPPRQV